MKLIDHSLGLNNQALAVMAFLQDEEIETNGDCSFVTSAWYNGRERGFVVSCRFYKLREVLHIAVFEHRNSDSICALRWLGTPGINPPTIASDGELAYPTNDKFGDIAHRVEFGQVGQMAFWLRDEVQKYVDSKRLKTVQ